VLVSIASALTIFVGPGANGSGIAELMACLNGVNYPLIIGKRTLFVKVLCVVLGICGSLYIGKEGPLAHIGGLFGPIVIYYLPIKSFDYFKNDVNKREFMVAGISAGVSAAFASPIGGTMFAYELSKPTTFWTFSMIWRVFFCCSICTFTLSLLDQAVENFKVGPDERTWTLTSGGTLKFGELYDIKAIKIRYIHGAIVLGVIGGALGALFVNVNTRMSLFRKKYIDKSWKKIVEACFYGVMTISAATFFVNLYKSDCISVDDDKSYISWTCPEGQFNPLATLFYSTESGAIHSLFGDTTAHFTEIHILAIFAFCWYFFTITTYGVWCPAGLFLPGIIMGGAMGRLYT